MSTPAYILENNVASIGLRVGNADADGFAYDNPSRMGDDVGGGVSHSHNAHQTTIFSHNSCVHAVVNDVDAIRHRDSSTAQGSRYAGEAL